MIGKLKEVLRLSGGEWLVSFTTREDPRLVFDKFAGKDVNVEIKKASKGRSRTANDFMWAMCSDIAGVLRITKEEVYRKAMIEVRDAVGKFESIHMRAEAIPTFREIWSQRGIAWFTEVVDYSPIPGCKVVLAYYGSSTFDSRQMSILIDNLKQEMVNLELPIPVSAEREKELLEQWKA